MSNNGKPKKPESNGAVTVLPAADRLYEGLEWHTKRGFTTGVYSITNKLDGKRYIGSAAKSFKGRWWTHINALRKGKHQNKHLQSAWNRDGESNFDFEVAYACKPEECIAMEQYFIDFWGACGKGYNFLPVAGRTWLGGTHGPVAREKIRRAQLGRKHTPEAKEKMRQAKLGKKLSPEHAAKTIAALKRRVITAESLKKRGDSLRGQKRTPEQLARIRAMRKPFSQASRDKMRASALAYYQRKREANAKA